MPVGRRRSRLARPLLPTTTGLPRAKKNRTCLEHFARCRSGGESFASRPLQPAPEIPPRIFKSLDTPEGHPDLKSPVVSSSTFYRRLLHSPSPSTTGSISTNCRVRRPSPHGARAPIMSPSIGDPASIPVGSAPAPHPLCLPPLRHRSVSSLAQLCRRPTNDHASSAFHRRSVYLRTTSHIRVQPSPRRIPLSPLRSTVHAPHSAFITPHSALITPHSAFTTPLHHPPSALRIPLTSLQIPRSQPRSAPHSALTTLLHHPPSLLTASLRSAFHTPPPALTTLLRAASAGSRFTAAFSTLCIHLDVN